MGWLVFSGIPPSMGADSPHLAENILSHADLAIPPRILSFHSNEVAQFRGFTQELEELLNVPVEIQSIDVAPVEDIKLFWLTSGILILAGGTGDKWAGYIREFLFKVIPEEILNKGSLLFAVGEAAAAFGAWLFLGEGYPFNSGLGWLQDSIVLPGVEKPSEIEVIREHLVGYPNSYVLALPDRAVFALGPEGEVEVWGEDPPVIALGAGWNER